MLKEKEYNFRILTQELHHYFKDTKSIEYATTQTFKSLGPGPQGTEGHKL